MSPLCCAASFFSSSFWNPRSLTSLPYPHPQSPAACGMSYNVRACVWCSLVSVLISAVLPSQVFGLLWATRKGCWELIGLDSHLREDSENSQDTGLGPFVLVNEELWNAPQTHLKQQKNTIQTQIPLLGVPPIKASFVWAHTMGWWKGTVLLWRSTRRHFWELAFVG